MATAPRKTAPRKTAAPKPQDHLPKQNPAKAEAQGRDLVVDFEGTAYSITRDRADDLEIMEFVEDQNYIKALRGYLGLEQWNAWKDQARGEDGIVRTSTFEELLDSIMKAIGGAKDGSPNS